MNNNSQIDSIPRYLSVRDSSIAFRWPIGGLRWAIFNARENGLEPAIKRCGRKILIDRFAFEKWIESSTSEERHA